MDVNLDLSRTVLESPRLVLRPWRQEDLADFYAYASVPGVGECAGWPHHTDIQVSQRILESFIADKNVFALQHRTSGRVIGSFGVHPSWANAHAQYAPLQCKEIGYVLAKEHWGQGLATEAARCVLHWLFEDVGLQAVTVGHFVENDRSRRVIEKCGFTYVDDSVFHARQLGMDFAEKRYILLRENYV